MAPSELESREQFIRVIVADSQAIFRAGLRKLFAVEDEIRMVGQAETLPQAVAAAQKYPAEIFIFEAALAEHPLEAVQEILKAAPAVRMVVVLERPEQELTLDLVRRGVHAVVSRDADSKLFVECLRTVAAGEPWLEPQAVKWVLEAFRTQARGPQGGRAKVQLTPKESLIVSCVTQGMKNKEIAARVGTTEQVVKNYLRKVYDKLGVADRLELALYCLNNRVALDPPAAAEPAAAGAAAASGQASSQSQEPAPPAPAVPGDSKDHTG